MEKFSNIPNEVLAEMADWEIEVELQEEEAAQLEQDWREAQDEDWGF
jgi:hypothetical protein